MHVFHYDIQILRTSQLNSETPVANPATRPFSRPQPRLPPPSPAPHVPGGEAGLAALAAAGVQSRAIVEEAAERQLLPDGLALILLRLRGKERGAA